MTNTNTTYRHVELAMPVAGRALVSSLCALSTRDRVVADQKWVVDAAMLEAGIAPAADVTTGAFPGIHAWSPPS